AQASAAHAMALEGGAALAAVGRDSPRTLDAVASAVDAAAALLRREGERAPAAAALLVTASRWQSLLLFAASFAVAAAGVAYFTRRVSRPLGRALKFADELAQGNLGADIKTESA